MSRGILWLGRRGAGLGVAIAALGFMPGLAGNAWGTMLTSGNTVTMPGSGVETPGTLKDSMSEDFTSANGLFTGTLDSWVYSDPTNPFGAGDYDFVYQLSNTTPGNADSFDRLSLSSFGKTGMTDVDYVTDVSEVAPATADRLIGVVGFNFTGNEIAPNESSDFLIVKTDANAYFDGSGSIIDGDSASAVVEAPFAVGTAPEPASIGLLIVGSGMVLCRRWRRERC